MGKCPLCGGDKRKGHTTYTVDLGYGVVVVRDVPAKICSQCGEEWINSKIAEELENIIESAREKKAQLEVLPFRKAIRT